MIAEKEYKYKLEKHPNPKGTCPGCGTEKAFRHYEGMDRKFGICDRKNNCAYENIPTNEKSAQMSQKEPAPVKIIYPSLEFCKATIENQTSNFHTFCLALGITQEHLQTWNCGTVQDKTAFVHKNIHNQFVNIKQIQYGTNGKRSEKMYWLPRKNGEEYKQCLYGEHLLSNKIVCAVESEKTAIIASFFYKDFDWIATGSANGLTNEKISVLFGREIYYLCDADKAGRESSSIKTLQQYEQNYKVIDLFPERNDKSDLADYIIEGLMPDIKPTESIKAETKQVATAPEKRKNISDFEKVKNFLSDRYEIRFNEVSNEIENRNKGEQAAFTVLNENNIYIELQENFINFSQAKVTALLRSSYVTTYNPFQDYFDSLGDWTDSDRDYIDKVCDYIPVKEADKRRFRVQFKKMLVRCIACSLLPNVFNKQAFIFVHDKQNSGKSTFCRWLCPPTLSAYITENISTDKDSLICLSDNFIINMDELATLNKAEINTLKAMMSKDVVKVRRPYDKKPILTPRRANFVGSTNKTEFLSDETGSVRWLCFELTDRLNFAYKLDIDINNVWKQAYTLFKQGFKYELTPEEIKENELSNREYSIVSEEQELIQMNYLPGNELNHRAFYTASDFKRYLTEKYNTVKLNVDKIGKALKVLGFQQRSKRLESASYPIKGYYVNFIESI